MLHCCFNNFVVLRKLQSERMIPLDPRFLLMGGIVKIVLCKGWLSIRLRCSINICFKFLTAGPSVVTKGNKHSWPLGFCLCVRADCREAKLTPGRDLSMIFCGYSLALRRCLNFKKPSLHALCEELVLSNLITSPLMKPYFTPGGWHEAKYLLHRIIEIAR